MLDVSDINLIKTIAEVGSINKAADKLFMSQPTLSKRVSRLEQVLKIELFHRHSGGMIPTEAASYLISNAKHIQSKLDSMRRHIERLAELQTGSLHIGIGPITEQVLFPDALITLTNQTSNLSISLHTEYSERILEMVQDGSVDLGIGPFHIESLPEELISFPVIAEKIIFVARPEHPVFDKKEVLSLTDLLEYDSITPKVSQSILDSIDTPLFKDFPLISCSNYSIAKSMAINSNYITSGPQMLFDTELENATLKKIPIDIDIDWTSYCIIRPEAIHTPSVKKFIDIIKNYKV